jgi:hypothetical protein
MIRDVRLQFERPCLDASLGENLDRDVIYMGVPKLHHPALALTATTSITTILRFDHNLQFKK